MRAASFNESSKLADCELRQGINWQKGVPLRSLALMNPNQCFTHGEDESSGH